MFFERPLEFVSEFLWSSFGFGSGSKRRPQISTKKRLILDMFFDRFLITFGVLFWVPFWGRFGHFFDIFWDLFSIRF